MFFKKTNRVLLPAAVLLLAVWSCSTTRVIPEGSSRLKQNKVKVLNDKRYPVSDITPYIKQKPNSYYIFGWNPFLNVYNWTTGKGKGWDRFVQKLGVAPVIYDSSLVSSSIGNIKNHLEYNGYYGSSVSKSVVTKRKKTTVNYNVTLGKRYAVSDVVLRIDDPVLDSIVRSSGCAERLKKEVWLSEKVLESESSRLTSVIRNNGFYAFDSGYFHFEADTLIDRDSAKLFVYVRNYTRKENPENAVRHTKYYFRNVNVLPALNLADYGIYGDIDEYVQYDTVKVDDVNVISWSKPILRPKVISHTNRIVPGSLYNERDITSTYNRFTNLRVFSSVNVQIDKVDSNHVDCTVKLVPSKVQGYKINFEVSANSNGLFGVSPAISYYNKNIFKGGEWFDLSFMGNFQFKFNNPIRSNEFGVSASLSFPKFVFLPDRLFEQNLPRTDVSLSYNYQSRPEYTRNIISATYGYNWNVNRRFFYRVNPIQINIVNLANLSNEFYSSLKDPYLRNSYQNHFDLGLGTSFYFTTNPAVNPKTSYFYFRWQNDLAGNFLSLFNPVMKKDEEGSHLVWGTPYSQFYRTEVQAVYTLKFGKNNRHSVAARVLGGVGVAYGNSTALPFEKLFWAGGANSLRGWSAKSVGPGMAQRDTTFRIPNQTGDFRLEANLEYRFPIFWKFAGAVFADAGNVWNLKSANDDENSVLGKLNGSTFLNSIAVSYGLGLRLDLEFVLLRLDLGFVGYDPRRQSWIAPRFWFGNDNYALQFGVGYPF